jgi:AraC-like DNA-binding protein
MAGSNTLHADGSDYAMPHKAKSIQIAVGCLDRLGLSAEDCLAQTGIAQEALTNPDSEITLSQELAFYQNLAGMSRDLPIGLNIGAEYRVENYGIWGLAIMSAATLRESLQIALQFQSLTFTFFNYELIEECDKAYLMLSPMADFGDCTAILADRDMAASALIVQQVIDQKASFQSIAVRHSASGHESAYQAHYGCGIEFGASAYALQFPVELLDEVPIQASQSTAAICANQCAKLVAELKSGATIAGRIQQRLMLCRKEFPTGDAIADELLISRRTMRRQLSEAGTTYQSILDEVRLHLAKKHLKKRTMPLADIAAELGFSEPGNFTHAFKRWTGVTPSAYRKAGKTS